MNRILNRPIGNISFYWLNKYSLYGGRGSGKSQTMHRIFMYHLKAIKNIFEAQRIHKFWPIFLPKKMNMKNPGIPRSSP